MSMCDVLLHHCRTMLLYVWGYAVAYAHLLCTLGLTYTYTAHCAIDTTNLTSQRLWRLQRVTSQYAYTNYGEFQGLCVCAHDIAKMAAWRSQGL